MSALDDILKRDGTKFTVLEWAVILFTNDTERAERAAAELIRLEAIEKAAIGLLIQLPIGEIEIAREAWGNTNTEIILHARKELADAYMINRKVQP